METVVPENPPSSGPQLEAERAFAQLEQKENEVKTKSGHLKAYTASILLPPIGIYYFVKYFFFGEKTPYLKKTAVYCLILTVISLAVNIWGLEVLFNQAVPSKDPNINVLQELITPENQKSLRQLMQ